MYMYISQKNVALTKPFVKRKASIHVIHFLEYYNLSSNRNVQPQPGLVNQPYIPPTSAHQTVQLWQSWAHAHSIASGAR